MEVVVERLQGHNIKPSVQRIAIMKYLMEHRTHPTVDEIYTALSPTIPTLSKTTVYNNNILLLLYYVLHFSFNNKLMFTYHLLYSCGYWESMPIQHI